MKKKIIAALKETPDLLDWSVRQIISCDHQMYFTPLGIETERVVDQEHYELDILKETSDETGERGCGQGNAMLLAGDDISQAIEDASLRAELVHNPKYRFAEPKDIPAVPLVDEKLNDDLLKSIQDLNETLKIEVEQTSQVRLTSAEFFIEDKLTRLFNSRGIDAEQKESLIHLEYVLTASANGEKAESFVSLSRRRLEDLHLSEYSARHVNYAIDSLRAAPPQEYTGPVILRHQALADFMNSYVLKALSSAEFKYNQITPWELGAPIHSGEVKGDPFTVWANRLLPYGVNSNCFDSEGLPAQNILLIKDHKLVNFTADQRFSEYLSVPATGDFGNLEVAAGCSTAKDLLSADHVEVAAFSWFNPDILSGDFASEIRLGYFVHGKERKPFKGGMLVGNLLSALADVHFSQETELHGDYIGPTTARFEKLSITSG